MLVVCAVLVAACGGEREKMAELPEQAPTVPPPSLFARDESEGLRAAPRWETVTTLSGTGAVETKPFAVADGAIQWRVAWSCETCDLQMATIPPPDGPEPLVRGTCPGQGVGYSIETGNIRLAVDAVGSWEARVEQQVDSPIDEPPLPEMADAEALAEGSFYEIDEEGFGRATLYQLLDGRRALRLEDFEVFHNTDLVVWLSEDPKTESSAAAAEAPHVEIAPLKSTIGPQNYLVQCPTIDRTLA